MANLTTGRQRAGGIIKFRLDDRKTADDALKRNLTMNLKAKNDIILLGLDISTITTGFCFINAAGKILKAGTIQCKGIIPEKMQTMRNELCRLLNEYKPTLVAIEDMIAFKFGHVAKLLNYFNGVAYLTCFDYNGNDVQFIASSSVKKMLGVNPRALKKEGLKPIEIKDVVYAAVVKAFRLKIDNSEYAVRHDIADACGVAFKLLEKIKEKKS